MKIYWKVHIKNFDSFITFIIKEHSSLYNADDWYSFKEYYNLHHNKYLYLCVNFSYNIIVGTLSYASYHIDNKKWLDINNWQYMGEYNGRKDKLERLNNISNL